MSDRVSLWLARHGETVWHAENRYAGGDSDIDLTSAGHEQASDLGRWSLRHGIEVVVSSPVRRAQETAQPSASAIGADLVVCPGLKEVAFGVAEGRTAAEIESSDAAVMAAFRDDPVANPFPGAESAADAAARGAGTLREIAAEHAGRKVLVVAHNTLLRLALCELLGIPPAQYRRVFPRLDNTAVAEVVVPLHGHGLAALRSLNVPTRAAPT
ncbi:histidine phosphatase family protein [Allobranchiibius sp. GilTou73]|uniref:histidine phosphatase family protein n=1 Tax=Allobranchiibius sp. GilTou73 TaxID=2904523 RepID=UPI001F31C1E8|nr:histidine phosphatase family protein [Allobranchiibius sp. GilTou73]UIJ34917.1 histidine phosphatase family protein [Allobranchiibius sp. GilTou73]